MGNGNGGKVAKPNPPLLRSGPLEDGHGLTQITEDVENEKPTCQGTSPAFLMLPAPKQ